MCGFTGFVNPRRTSLDLMEKNISAMNSVLGHRGPDDSGTWSEKDSGVALGHRRLSILDLSSAGHQPMLSNSNRYVIVFNGEIYNHLKIRESLNTIGNKAASWQGHSDTETLLAAIELWGIERTLKACVGMFSIALWDREEKALTLARDRFGEKPLYYGWFRNIFLFGSELKAVKAYPGFDNAISRQALAEYLRFMYVPAPRSIYKDIYKLEPGSFIKLSVSDLVKKEIIKKKYWSLSEVVDSGQKNLISNEEEALFELEVSLRNSVKSQMLSDVPLGAFLSGGVDSSTIVALMQGQSLRPVKTFTVAFEDPHYDESLYARKVAHHLGTEHSELTVTAQEARDVIPSLAEMYDEPFADSSQIPTHLVCKAARQQVTVALSGDAGDEVFGGYNRYFWGPKIWNKAKLVPYPFRQFMAFFLQTLSPSTWDNLLGHSGVVRPGEKLHKLSNALKGINSLNGLYENLISEWTDPEAVVKGLDLHHKISVNIPKYHDQIDEFLSMMYSDSLTYLPDDILCKVDRAAMYVSLETRIPFLDTSLIDLAWRLPGSMKVRNGQGKWALRQILYKYVPKELIERPKTGFSIPVGDWLRGPLKDWAEELLDESRLDEEGYFYPEPIREKWAEHLGGKYDWTPRLWSILMFQSWLEEQK